MEVALLGDRLHPRAVRIRVGRCHPLGVQQRIKQYLRLIEIYKWCKDALCTHVSGYFEIYKWRKDALYTHVSGFFVNATLSPPSNISCSTLE